MEKLIKFSDVENVYRELVDSLEAKKILQEDIEEKIIINNQQVKLAELYIKLLQINGVTNE